MNDTAALSDDPAVPGFEDPTCFIGCELIDVPAASSVALLLLAGLLAAFGALRLRGG